MNINENFPHLTILQSFSFFSQKDFIPPQRKRLFLLSKYYLEYVETSGSLLSAEHKELEFRELIIFELCYLTHELCIIGTFCLKIFKL